MMKQILVILTLLFFSFSKSHKNKLEGRWILDKITYQNGNPLEVNHPLYSTFMEYNFKEDNLEINKHKLKIIIDSTTISTDYRKLNYKIENGYLIIIENGDDKVYYFMKINDYLRKYPEFEPKEIIYANKNVFEANSMIKPEFNYTTDFETFITRNMPVFPSISNTNNFFKAKFILTKDNKITDLQIIKGISKSFDNQFRNALLKSEEFMKNNFGKDLLVTQTYNFFKMFAGLPHKKDKQMYAYIQKGNSFYLKNDFGNAIVNYEKLLSLGIEPEARKKFGPIMLSEAFIRLGISYLATGNKEKACEAFKSMGDKTNFGVRNYLINFCK